MPILQDADPIIQLVMFTMVVLQIIFHNSCRSCHFLLSMLHYIVQLCLLCNGRILTASDCKLLSDFPKDPDSAAKQFQVSSHKTIYTVCPKRKCQKLYLPVYQNGSSIPQYPMYCTHKAFDNDKKCGTHITRPRKFGKIDVKVPIKRFVAFSFKLLELPLGNRASSIL